MWKTRTPRIWQRAQSIIIVMVEAHPRQSWCCHHRGHVCQSRGWGWSRNAIATARLWAFRDRLRSRRCLRRRNVEEHLAVAFVLIESSLLLRPVTSQCMAYRKDIIFANRRSINDNAFSHLSIGCRCRSFRWVKCVAALYPHTYKICSIKIVAVVYLSTMPWPGLRACSRSSRTCLQKLRVLWRLWKEETIEALVNTDFPSFFE